MRLNKNTYTKEEVREIIEYLLDEDSMEMFSAKEVQAYLKLGSVDTARRLMNHPALKVLQIGRTKLISKGELKKFISFNAGSYIDLY